MTHLIIIYFTDIKIFVKGMKVPENETDFKKCLSTYLTRAF
jgi:hypothetical protein